MKKIILTVVLAIGMIATTFAQTETFKFNNITKSEKNSEYLNLTGSYVVLNIEGSVEELYQITKNWINETYNDPDEVIISDTENSFLKIQGVEENLFKYNTMAGVSYNDAQYRLSFKFKENKIKVELTSLHVYFPPNRYSIESGWKDNSSFIITKKNGKPFNNNRNNIEPLEEYFNLLAFSLKNSKDMELTDNDNW